MKHLGKKRGVTIRSCSKCGGDLGDRRYTKQRYCKACHAKYMREHRPKHKDLKPLAKLKANARAYAHVYVKRGKIQKKPCEKCGDVKSEIHHPDYSKPTLVVWLCRKHHLELHG